MEGPLPDSGAAAPTPTSGGDIHTQTRDRDTTARNHSNRRAPQRAPIPVASQVMARRLITLRPDDRVRTAIDVLVRNNISGAPVVDDDGALLGILGERLPEGPREPDHVQAPRRHGGQLHVRRRGDRRAERRPVRARGALPVQSVPSPPSSPRKASSSDRSADAMSFAESSVSTRRARAIRTTDGQQSTASPPEGPPHGTTTTGRSA